VEFWRTAFSLHAGVRCDAHERQRLEQLCRTITRPALVNERVQINSAGQVVRRLKTAWRDGTNFGFLHPNSKRLIALLQVVLKMVPGAIAAWVKPHAALRCPCCGEPMHTGHHASVAMALAPRGCSTSKARPGLSDRGITKSYLQWHRYLVHRARPTTGSDRGFARSILVSLDGLLMIDALSLYYA